MAHVEKALTASWADWSDEAAQILSGALNHASIADIRAQVESGADLFKVEQDGQLVGYYALRIDRLASGNEGVIVAAAGRAPDFDLTVLIVPMIEQQFKNCVAVRIHTARAGLVKKLSQIGYQPQEMVLRKALHV